MKLAIMQPYFFPYIGYWQLIHAVDRFVIYDDVNYIKSGWINRNRILINGTPTYITVPLFQSSSFKKICDTKIQTNIWRNKLVKMVETTYRRSPGFEEVFPVIYELIRYETDNLADYLANQIKVLSEFMGIKTEFVVSSRCYSNDELSGQDRILDICNLEKATTYINPQGGMDLYDSVAFYNKGINLHFIFMQPMTYKQKTVNFIPSLSIIDVLMEVGPRDIIHYLDAFELLN